MWVDHRNATSNFVRQQPRDTGDTDIEHAGPRAIRALFGAIVGDWCPIITVKGNVRDDLVGLGRNDARKRRIVRIVCHHHEMIIWIVAEFIGPVVVRWAGEDRICGTLWYVDWRS